MYSVGSGDATNNVTDRAMQEILNQSLSSSSQEFSFEFMTRFAGFSNISVIKEKVSCYTFRVSTL